jgi:hypothetical protein
MDWKLIVRLNHGWQTLTTHQGIINLFRHEDIVRIINLATKNINDQD